jgi:triacylglycerol lipase
MVYPRLRNPILLVHGLLGFDAVRLGKVRLRSYFPGIEESMRQAGNRVHCANLSPTAGVARRAEQLKELLNRVSPNEPAHLITHSMGGLDSRFMISRLGMADRVLSLTTIGTPHHGSPIADWGTRRLGSYVKPLFRFFAIPDQAFYDLTTEGCRKFNADVPDVANVRYFAVAGRCTLAWLGPEWIIPYTVIRRSEGQNDGMVSVASATWGEKTDVWDGDHVSLVNWPNPQALALGIWRCRRRQYAGLVQRLADIGF